MSKRRVYLEAGSQEQYHKVRDEYLADPDMYTDNIEFVYLMGVGQITEEHAEIWVCSELHRATKNYNVIYDM